MVGDAVPAPESVEEVSDADAVEMVEEELIPIEAPPVAVLGVLEQAVADARQASGPGGDGWRRQVEVYQRELEAASAGEPDKALVALYNHELGELLESRAGDEGAAVKAYARALQADATLKPNLWAIRRVFERRQLWPNLLKLLDAEIRFARNADEKAELLVERGHLLEDRLDDAAQARESYLKATEVWPRALGAWMALERLCAREGDLGTLGRVWRGMADATAEPGRKVALLIDLARLEGRLAEGSPDRAQALLLEALALDVDAERVLDELEHLAERSGRAADLTVALDARVARLIKETAGVPIGERLVSAEKLVALRRRQAEAARAAGDAEAAWGHLHSAFELAADDPLLVRELCELAEALGRWDEWAALLLQRSEAAPPYARAGLKLARAEALARAGRPAEAETLEAEVQRDEPGHLGVWVARERAALAVRDWDTLAGLYQQEAELATATSPPDLRWAAGALTRAAHAHAERGRDAEAQSALTLAATLVPHHPPVVDALERLYTRGHKWAELAALYEAELEAPHAPQVRYLEGAMAARERLDDAAGAAVLARKLCTLRPDDVRARARLVELDRAGARWAEAAEDLAVLARLVPEERRVEVLLERADLLEHRLDDPLAAAATYKQALAIEPGEPRAAAAFEALSRRRAVESGAHERPTPEAWDDLAAALAREAEASPERAEAALLKLGEIHERERHDFAAAAAAYHSLLERTPGHAAAERGLGRALAAAGDGEGQAAALAAEVAALAPEARAAAELRVGELWEDRLGDRAAATAAYARAAASSPGDAHVAYAQLRGAVYGDDAATLAATLDAIAAAVGDGEGSAVARALLDAEQGELWRRAGDAARAAASVRAASDGDEAARLPWRMQARLAAARSDAGALGSALAAEAARTNDGAWAAALDRRAGLLALVAGAGELGRERLGRARERAPGDAAALVALCDGDGADAEALTARAELAEGAAAAAWHLESAEAHERAGRGADAVAAALRVLAVEPHSLPALELLRRLARAADDQPGYARATARLAAALRNVERAAALLSEAGETFERCGQPKEAAAAFRALLDKQPRDATAFARARDLLRALHVKERVAGPLVELYTHRLGHTDDVEERHALYLDRARLAASAGDSEAAERDLRAALARAPSSLGATRQLADLLAALPSRREEAIALFTRYLEDENDRGQRRSALSTLSELEEAAGRPDEAVRHLEEAVRLAPTLADARAEHERMAQVYIRQRSWQRAVDVLRRLAELVPDGGARARIEIRVATIYREGFADPRAAVEALLRALRAEPLEMDALSRLIPLSDQGHVHPLELEEKLDNAIQKARTHVEIDSSDLEPYQALSRLWQWRGDADMRMMAAQAEALVAGRVPPSREPAAEPTKELSARSWERIHDDTARSVALELWRAAGDAAAALYGPALEQVGVGKRDRVNAKGTPQAWIPVERVAHALLGTGVGYELYASPSAELCVATGGALVCGSAFANGLSPVLRFRVARKLALLRDRLGALELLDDDELTVFFAALVRVAELPRPPLLAAAPEARVEERTRALGRALARRDKKALAALGTRVAELPLPSVWRRAVLDGATRAALVVGGDLGAALRELNLDLRADQLARDLVRFTLSEDYRVLRRELGLKI